MALQRQNQGILNRVRGSISFPSLTGYNITSPYLGKRGITARFIGKSAILVDTMTGAVTSGEPFVRVELTIDMVRTQALAAQWQALQQVNSLIGQATWRTDAVPPGVSLYTFDNVVFDSMDGFTADGMNADWPLRLAGIYYTNSNLFT